MSRKIRHENVPTEFHANTEAEALFLEQAQAYFRDMQNIANNAPYGKVLDQVETAVIVKSRELVKQSTEFLIQEQINNIEKKKKRRSAKNVKRKKDTKDTPTKQS